MLAYMTDIGWSGLEFMNISFLPLKCISIIMLAGMSMEVSNELVGWFTTYLRDLQPT